MTGENYPDISEAQSSEAVYTGVNTVLPGELDAQEALNDMELEIENITAYFQIKPA